MPGRSRNTIRVLLSVSLCPPRNHRCPNLPRLFTSFGSRVMEGGEDRDAGDDLMESTHVHYHHTDPCCHFRWTVRESYGYMYRRPWQIVSDFYSQLVSGSLPLHSLFSGPATATLATGAPSYESEGLAVFEAACGCHRANGIEADGFAIPALTKERTGRWARTTFKIVVSYHGGSFDGWQKQPGLNTVQGTVEKALGRFVDEKKAQQLKEKSLPVEGCAVVAGRTDKGVSALQQVCSFYTWRKEVNCSDIKDAINSAVPGRLRALSVSKVSRTFHPNFSAKWRRYFYIFPLDKCGDGFSGAGEQKQMTTVNQEVVLSASSEDTLNVVQSSFSVKKVNQLLCQLEGKTLSYKMYARDTKASRSTGPPTECCLFHARAMEATLPFFDQDQHAGTELGVMCIELVANRFLRRMVRVLVATSIREAAAGASDDALLNLMEATCRRATAPPAPPDGLCLVDVGYGEFRKENCFIN